MVLTGTLLDIAPFLTQMLLPMHGLHFILDPCLFRDHYLVRRLRSIPTGTTTIGRRPHQGDPVVRILIDSTSISRHFSYQFGLLAAGPMPPRTEDGRIRFGPGVPRRNGGGIAMF